MRSRFLLLALTLAVPTLTSAQTPKRAKDVEKFEVTGLPKAPASQIEKEIFVLLRAHKRGDYTDASRIHLKLAQYYKERGQEQLEDVCNQKAMEAWSAASGERPSSAGSPGSPPFEPAGTFARLFSYTDDLKFEHTWEFFADGTFAHAVETAEKSATAPPRERGWYSLSDGKMRLWQFKPRAERAVRFELRGEGGKDGAVMDDIKLVVVP